MKEKYILPSIIQRFERKGRIVLINPTIPAWIVTNDVGELLLRLLDGSRTIQEAEDLAVEGFGENSKEKIHAFYLNAINSSIFDTIEKDPHHRFKLHIVHLSLSDSCNLNCSYCYAEQRKERGEKHLTLHDYYNLIDSVLSINRSCAFNLTGGEPLLNKDWYDIAKYIKSNDCECLLLSNGTLINDSNIRLIKEVFDQVIISIDGSSAGIHSLTRGNNYDKIMDTIRLFEDNHISYRLSMTVTRNNIFDVEEMAKKYGNRLRFAPLFPVSDMASDQLSITGLEYYYALKSAYGVEPLSHCNDAFENAQHSRCHKCALGDGEISISATGDVYPCQLLHKPDFFAGNVIEKSIIEIYNNSEALRKCADLDVDCIEGCKECAFRYICGGSCRARAYYECGNIAEKGNFCVYEKEAYLDGLVSLYSNNALEP